MPLPGITIHVFWDPPSFVPNNLEPVSDRSGKIRKCSVTKEERCNKRVMLKPNRAQGTAHSTQRLRSIYRREVIYS